VEGSLDSLFEFLTQKRLLAQYSWENGNKVKRVNFQADKINKPNIGMEVRWNSLVCLDTPVEQFEKDRFSTNGLKFEIKLGDQMVTVPLEYELKVPEGKLAEMRYNIAFIEDQLKFLSEKVLGMTGKSFNTNDAEKSRDLLGGLREMLNDSIRDLFKLKVSDRKMMMEVFNETKEYIDKVANLLKQAGNQGISNEQIAQINAMAYRNVCKKNLLKTLDKRADANVELMNTVATKAKEAAESFNEDELNHKYTDLAQQVGCCSLNLSNMVEAMVQEDCLCLTFDIGRPEVAIADASRVIIKKIYPTVICASAFLDSIKYSMKLNPNSTGGFDPQVQGDIVKGASNESITAAMPLFLCGDHWKIASQYIKPIIGWDVTLDPLGYDYNQLRTVPFLILTRALIEKNENPDSEFYKRVFGWVLDTCVEILRDEMKNNAENNLAEKTKKIWNDYMKDGSQRSIEVVQNNGVFLAHLYVLQEMGHIERLNPVDFSTKYKFIVEEEMRRRQDKACAWNITKARKNAKRLLNLDIDKYITALAKVHKEEEEEKIGGSGSGTTTTMKNEGEEEIKFEAPNFSEDDFKQRDGDYSAAYKSKPEAKQVSKVANK
jgi:hypothetical protein